MEDKLNPAAVGAFVLGLGAALVAAVLWLAAGLSSERDYGCYQSIFNESVSGLNHRRTGQVPGVDVGKVHSIRIDPANSRQVRLGLLIVRGTPVKQDSEAVLKSQGLTGIAYVELSGGSPGSPTLPAANGDEVPTIRSKPSLSARLENVLSTVLASVDRSSANLNALLDDGNRAALKQTLADAAAVVHAVAAQKDALAHGLADAALTARRTAQASAQLAPALARVEPVLLRMDAAAAAVETLARSAHTATDRAGQVADVALDGVQHLRGSTLPELDRLLAELGPLVASLRQLSEQTRAQPGSLLRGVAARPPGPGEVEVTP